MIKLDLKFSPADLKYINSLPEILERGHFKGLKTAMLFAEGASKKVFAESGPVKPDILTARSGHLRRSIKGRAESVREGILSSNVEYAGIHEYGGIATTRAGSVFRMPKRPFLKPALEGDNLDKIRDIIKESIVKEFK